MERPSILRIAGFFAVIAVFIATTANLAFAAHYMGKVYPGVEVNGVALGGLDRDEARIVLAKRISNYSLNLQLGEKRQRIQPTDAGVSYDLEATLDIALSAGRRSPIALAGLWEQGRALAGYAYRVDKTGLNALVEQLADTGAAMPVDADIVMHEGSAQIVPDKPGLAYNRSRLAASLREALARRLSRLAIQPEVTPAEVRAESLAEAAGQAERLAGSQIELVASGRVFRPSKAEVGSWLVFPKSGTSRSVQADAGRIKSYLGGLARQVDIKPVNKRVIMINGEIKSEEGGVDGLGIDQETLSTQIAASLPQTGKLRLDVPMRPVAYKTEYNRTVSLAYGRYIEVNLATQRMFAYQDGQLVHYAPITSGASGHGFGTKQGLFSIYHKARGQWLDGRSYGWNYRVYVDYWMPFSGGYGLHDADWRSSFGGPDYYYGGSHGCVNMAKSNAAWLYDWAPVGTPVWVHI